MEIHCQETQSKVLVEGNKDLLQATQETPEKLNDEEET
jgi:hypothetical protein